MNDNIRISIEWNKADNDRVGMHLWRTAARSTELRPRGSALPMRYALAAVLIAATGLLSGCMVGPNYKRPSAPLPQGYKEPPDQGFKEGDGWKIAQPSDAAIRGKWWEIYNDPALNALEEQVSISNQNILSIEAQYRQALELVKQGRAAYFPQITLGPSVVNSQNSGTLYGAGQNAAIQRLVQQRTVYGFPLQMSYQADVWGSIRRTVTSNVDSAQVTAAQLENAKLSYQSTLAQTYFQLHGLDSSHELLERTVKSFQEYLQLTKDRFEAGIASDADVSQAESQLYTTQAQLVNLGVARAQYEHAIAVLTGKPPSAVTINRLVLKAPPPAIPVALPSVLLERRPDIAAAERQMAAANEQIGIAKAALYPQVSLTGTAGLQSQSPADWFTWPSRYWSVGPTFSQFLFDAGRRRAGVSQAQNAFEATVANYRQTVLTAFQQVEDNLAALKILAEQAQVQDQAVASSERALEISTAQYKAGTTDYLQVITTQSTALNNQRTAVDLLTQRITASVALVQALGGGWDASKLPTRDAIIHGQ